MPALAVGAILGFGLAFWLERTEPDPSAVNALKFGVLFAGMASTALYFILGLLVGFPTPSRQEASNHGAYSEAYEDSHADRGRARGP